MKTLEEKIENKTVNNAQDELDEPPKKGKKTKKSQVRNPVKRKLGPYPMPYQRSYEKLGDIDDFVENESLFKVLDYKTLEDYNDKEDMDFTEAIFKDATTLVETLDVVIEEIKKIDAGELSKRGVKKPATKIRRIFNSYKRVKDYMESY